MSTRTADEATPGPLEDEVLAEGPVAPRRRSGRGPGGFVRVAGGLEALGLPRVGPQVQLAGGLLGRRWRAELAASYRAPTTQFTAIDPAAGARVRMWAVGARGCAVLRPSVLEIPLCAGLEAGQVIGDGVGFEGGRRDRLPWLAAVLGPALAWAPRPWLALWLGAEVGLPVVRGSFSAAGLGQMFKIEPASLRAALGLELRLGGSRSSTRATDPARAGK